MSIRNMASINPDPRVRNLLLRARPAPTRHIKASPHVLRSKLDSARHESDTTPEELIPSSSQCVTLWNLLGESGATQAVFADEGDAEDNTPYTSAWETQLRFDTQDIMVEPEVIGDAHAYSRYLQISPYKPHVHQANQMFWANMPATVFQNTSATVTQSTVRKEMSSKELVRAQLLLQLEQDVPTSTNADKDFWARLPRNGTPCAKAEVQQLPTCEELAGNKGPATNKLRKKKQ
jgi:hypothetical protein